MSTPIYFICKYCRQIFEDVTQLKLHKRSKHRGSRKNVVHLHHFSLEDAQVKIEREYDEELQEDRGAKICYECPECAARVVDPLQFFIHLENHSSESQLFHTVDGRIMRLDELPSILQIFIPKIKLIRCTEICEKYCKLVPNDVTTTSPTAIATHASLGCNSSSRTTTVTGMKMRPRSTFQKISEVGDGEDSHDDGSNEDVGDKDDDDPTFPGSPIQSQSQKTRTKSTAHSDSLARSKAATSASKPRIKQTKDIKNRKPFHCRICNVGFLQKEYLIRHFTKHIENNPYKCAICGQHTDSKHQLQRHMFSHNGGNARVKCKLCNKTFSQTRALKHHTKTIHALAIAPDQKVYPCDVCGRAFNTELLAEAHVAMHKRKEEISKVKPLQCIICKARFQHNQYLLQHAVVHSEDNPYRCKICGHNKATTMYHLKRHMGNHNQVPKIPCDLCGKLFVDANLRRHMKVIHHNEWTLKRRGKNQTAKPELRSSRSRTISHPPTLADATGKKKLVDLDETTHAVLEDPKNLNSNRTSATVPSEHWRVTTIKKILEVDPRMKKKIKTRVYNPRNNFKCDVCLGQFSHSHSLRRHMQTLHSKILLPISIQNND